MLQIVAQPVDQLCAELQRLQRERVWHLKSRIMLENRLRATVAGTLGYHSGMKESDRAGKWKEAAALIKQISLGRIAHPLAPLVQVAMLGINAFGASVDNLEREMLACVKQLPIAAWAQKPEQRGFGLHSLAVLIGETGDLHNYANPAKVWRRMGCAPKTHDGKTLMGATWRAGKEGKLPAAEWEEYGYSPRRRSIAYVIGEGLVKQNGSGPYRARYDEAKRLAAENHESWKPLRCHLHAMLLATKLLLKNLWIEWQR